jgi:hypothetical protein
VPVNTSARRVALLLLASRMLAGCVECAADVDCSLVQECVEGGCRARPGSAIALVAPEGTVDGTFDLVVDVTFAGALATVGVGRDPASPGEPCIPFLAQQVVVEGTGERETRRVTLPRLPSLGTAFALRVSLSTSGAPPVERTFSFIGPLPGADVGGAVILTPGGEVDIDDTPLATVSGSVEGPAVAFVAPAAAPSLPRIVVADGPGPVDARLPLVRGPQTVWVETTTSVGTRRCGRTVLGGPAGDDGGALDVALIATAAEPAWVGLSLRARGADTTTVCADDRRDDERCRIVRSAVEPGTIVVEQAGVWLDDGVIDIAAVPRIAVGPVEGLVRVTHAGRHVGFFGPFSFLPDEGQSWIAGRVVLRGGVVVSAVGLDEVTFGAPW